MGSIFGQSLQLYYSKHAFRHFREREETLEKIHSREDALAYVDSVRRKCAGSFVLPKAPEVRKPARIVGKIPCAWGTIEKIVYYANGNGPVPANLYLPFSNGEKHPASLLLCGHNDIGKAAPAYQQLAMLLAKTGFAVMVIDPIGQGDRRQYGTDFKGHCWDEHSYIGRRLFPLGDWTGSRMVQDAVSAIDYLETRSEIDLSRLGVTGVSGGGTATAFLTAIEKRITISAPSCYVTSWENNISNERPTDNEQIPPHSLAQNLDIVDFLIARAPVPVLISGKNNDFFDPRGTRKAFRELQKIYSLLGKEDQAELYMGSGNHGLSPDLSRNVCSFFARHAGLPVPELHEDPETLTERELSCGKLEETLDPHILSELENRPVRKADPAAELKIALPVPLPEYYILRECSTGQTVFSRFALPEEGLVMSVLYKKDSSAWYHLPEKEETVVLYVADQDAKSEMKDFPDGSWGIDLRGIGETSPASCYQGEQASLFTLNGADYHYSALGLQLDLPLLGGKVHDLLKAAALLASSGQEIKLIARGNGCIPAMLAKRMDTGISSVELIDPPPGWEESVKQNMPSLPQSAMLFDSVGKFDWR